MMDTVGDASQAPARADDGEGHRQSGTTQPPSSYLGRLRLLVALDCLLVEGSVTRAARCLELSPAAVSRMLGQARDLYGDALLVRSGRRLVPTPLAEALRGRLRALAVEAERILEGDMPAPDRIGLDDAAVRSWRRDPIVEAPPLAMRPALLLDDQPSPDMLARRLADVRDERDPRRRLAKYLAIVGMKSGNSRPLTQSESQDAFATILRGEADPAQVGALLRLISYRGETAAELAGIVAAARDAFRPTGVDGGGADLDWPAYLSPRSLRTPWFVQSAMLVAHAGYRVAMHGAHAGGKLEQAAEAMGIPVALSAPQAAAMLSAKGIVYMPLAGFAPGVQALLSLYSLFEARSSINSAVHLLDPLSARALFLGVTQPAYRELHRDAAALLGHTDLSIIASSRDVAEWIPFRAMTMHRLVEGQPSDLLSRARPEPRAGGVNGLTSLEYWMAVWSGAARDARAVEIIVSTAALALMTLEKAPNERLPAYRRRVKALWDNRRMATGR